MIFTELLMHHFSLPLFKAEVLVDEDQKLQQALSKKLSLGDKLGNALSWSSIRAVMKAKVKGNMKMEGKEYVILKLLFSTMHLLINVACIACTMMRSLLCKKVGK